MNSYRYNPCSSQTAATKLTGVELISIFPEAKQIVPALTRELDSKRQALVLYIGKELAAIKAQSKDEVYRYFWRLWLMLNEGEELQETERKLGRLNQLQRVIDGKPVPKGQLPDNLIEAARNVPITEVVGEPVRRNLCICPLHDDHAPSLRIYADQNRAWCYGCNQGGNSIDLYMAVNDCDFKTAVRQLVGAAA
ncbi:MAG TPA: CHC2 zinc finger domain-containing protein [Candidatus Saccharimonadales bacterium]|nr:CHC2 zinc finger domain-containing protein [Candidatus Saccharimonadales bacterium]